MHLEIETLLLLRWMERDLGIELRPCSIVHLDKEAFSCLTASPAGSTPAWEKFSTASLNDFQVISLLSIDS